MVIGIAELRKFLTKPQCILDIYEKVQMLGHGNHLLPHVNVAEGGWDKKEKAPS